MLKTLVLTVILGTAVAVSTGIPRSVATGAHPLEEAGPVLLLATLFFAMASAVRRHGKGDRRS